MVNMDQSKSKAIILTIKMSIKKKLFLSDHLKTKTSPPFIQMSESSMYFYLEKQNKLVVVRLNQPLGQKVKSALLL